MQPSGQPTSSPSRQPTNQPSRSPTNQPTREPSSQPSSKPSSQPSTQPTLQPTGQPTTAPTSFPVSKDDFGLISGVAVTTGVAVIAMVFIVVVGVATNGVSGYLETSWGILSTQKI
jgi:hypothetical protein